VSVSEVPAGTTPVGGYDPSFFDQLATIEDRHFWFRARNRLIFELAKKISSGLKPGYLVLELGCGTGNVLRVLQQACSEGTLVGLELWWDGLRYARRRSTAFVVQGDVRNRPFGKQFELIGMFDVLEHVQEERETLDSLLRLLMPSGRLLLTVPAHKFLWSYFDEAAHHCRRYSPKEIHNKLTAAEFEVELSKPVHDLYFPAGLDVPKNRWAATRGTVSRCKGASQQRISFGALNQRDSDGIVESASALASPWPLVTDRNFLGRDSAES
jgi:SAM-dependent methyltransferase